MMEVRFFSAQRPQKKHGGHHLDPPPASTSEPLLHLALLLVAPPEARLLNLREPLSVLGPQLLHAAALQELLLLHFLTLLQNLVSGFELRANSAAARGLLWASRPLGVKTPPTAPTASATAAATAWRRMMTKPSMRENNCSK